MKPTPEAMLFAILFGVYNVAFFLFDGSTCWLWLSLTQAIWETWLAVFLFDIETS